MPVLRKFLSETRRELIAILIVLGSFMITMFIIWNMYGDKINELEKKIEQVKNQ